MATKNIEHSPASIARTIRFAEVEEGTEVEYIFDQFKTERDREQEENDACASARAFFMTAWARADMVQLKLEKLEENGINQGQVRNRQYAKAQRLEKLHWAHVAQDMVNVGMMPRYVAMRKLDEMCKDLKFLLSKQGRGLRGAHTWAQLAGLYNNLLSVLQDLDRPVWVKKQKKVMPMSKALRLCSFPCNYITDFNGKVIDHDCPEEVLVAARQERDGDDWQEEIRRMFYGIDD